MPTPEEDIEAVRALNADNVCQVAVAWERGTTALAVFVGSRTDIMRYTMSEDLNLCVSVEYVRSS